MAMSFHHGKFTWFDHLSSDPGKARVFYEGLFGWTVRHLSSTGRPYEMLLNGDDGIGGLFQAPPGVPTHWNSYLSVPDVDGKLKEAVAAGGTTLMQPFDFPGVGRAATVADPAGAVVSLWKAVDGDREDRERVLAGDWEWNELSTPDPVRALAFYEKVFGYTHDEMDMGPQGTYYVLKSADGKARGGVMKSPQAGMPAYWMPYVNVEDADKTAARVAPLGGSLLMPPESIPTVGRIAILTDSLGAAIGIIQPAVAA
jgi:uncharacterized protein